MMKSRSELTSLEPLLVCGLVVALALAGLRGLGEVISHNTQPLAPALLGPEESPPVTLANEESPSTMNR